MAQPRKIKIKLVKSVIGCSEQHKRIVRALGLRRTNHIVERFETPTIQGMLAKVGYLLQVEAA